MTGSNIEPSREEDRSRCSYEAFTDHHSHVMVTDELMTRSVSCDGAFTQLGREMASYR